MSGLIIRPLTLPLVEHPATCQLLYPHQAVMLDAWENRDSFVVMTKTGTGKTISAVLPVLKHRQRAICVYPTNELIRDQMRNIASIANREGLRVCIHTADTPAAEYASADVILTHVDAHALETWCKKRHWKEKWRALRELLEADKPKIILTNPDILFFIFALRYHAEPLAALPAYHVLIVDEFHLYSGVELAHALFMLHLGRSLGTFGKIVLLSATPAPEVSECVNRVLNDPLCVDASTVCRHPIVSERQAVHRVELIPRLAGQDVVETVVTIVKGLRNRIQQQDVRSSDYVPAVIVVNSVVNAIRLEDRLVEEGFRREEMAIIRGLSAREVRNTSGKLLAIGTSAIEVGIDFQCDYLIFEAGDAASFMQRFGRVGRHNSGVAYVLCPQNVLTGIEALSQTQGPEVHRGDLEQRVYSWYPNLDTRAWFSVTFTGLVSAFALAENMVKRVSEDFRATPEQVAIVEAKLKQFCISYGQQIRCSDKIVRRALQYLCGARRGESKYKWVTTYRDLNTFRTSLPSEWVLDFAELERRGRDWEKAKYTTDVATLLRRAEGLRFSEKIPHPNGGMGMLTVKGYGRYKKVIVMPTFTDEQCGIPYCTSDFSNLTFIQEGHKTSVSHVMTLRDHVFVVIPKAIRPDLDWRLPIFECGQHLVAFDGTALLLLEIFNEKLVP
ncbi:MAG: type I-D CRISPR-associated helicase Cas3' [Candidatus Methanosuratus sp.]|nr:type I-D CRISPR-associated helicase Cas3' [Candidatus Methanosuratincola sp.]